ncbi:MAG: GUN4 domain-containing protein [Myxococcales bacterium]|nr:GUN4 domain-containing protein [Myxococcales bacterium]
MSFVETSDATLSRLRALIRNGQMFNANKLTRSFLLPRIDDDDALASLDETWLEASQQRHGFSVQSSLLDEAVLMNQGPIQSYDIGDVLLIRSAFEDLGRIVGWRDRGQWLCWKHARLDSYYALVPERVSPHEAPRGMFPFHDVLREPHYDSEFSPRDCWGEDNWMVLLRVYYRVSSMSGTGRPCQDS